MMNMLPIAPPALLNTHSDLSLKSVLNDISGCFSTSWSSSVEMMREALLLGVVSAARAVASDSRTIDCSEAGVRS